VELVRFTGLERRYGAKEVFVDLEGVIREGDKIGIVGPNGAGKSSLVRVLAGRDQPDDGRLIIAPDARLGYLGQDDAERGGATLRAAFDAALAGGYAQEWEVRATLARFNFAEVDWDRPFREFSGGQRTRALLARTLLEQPDWLILDEPTNHLDLDTVRWLETTVARDPRAMVIVSHDRYFLETVANRIWELEAGELSTYEVPPGRAYTAYVEARDARREQARRDYEAALAERARQRAVIDELRTHGSHNYSHVRSREKALDRIDPRDAPRPERRAVSIALTAARRATTGWALEVSAISKGYTKPLFENISVNFARGDRVAIVGPNGAGKTTLLRILAGELAPDRGNVRYGTGLTMASYSQSSVDDLPAGVTATEAVARMGVTSEQARGLLGRLNLGGDAGDKPVEAFSGGERRRIMLARLMAQRADCLFLDEPTNDLDIASREALEDVLASYEGALFLVSHDRFLLARLAQRVVGLRDGALTVFEGDYAAYERAAHTLPTQSTNTSELANGTEKARASAGASAPKLDRREAHESKAERFRRKKAVSDAEATVARLEATRAELELRFSAPDLYDRPDEVVRLQLELDRAKEQIDAAVARWEEALMAYEAVP
jgi:ATP-binding cassette subfamily F protein 3